METSADVPSLIPVHGFLLDTDRNPVTGRFPMKFTIVDADDTELWRENRAFDHEVVVEAGRFSVYLGEVTALPQVALREAGELWLVLTVDDHDAARYRIPAGVCAQEANRGDRIGGTEPEMIQPILDTPCEEESYLRGWGSSSSAPLCGTLKTVSKSGSFSDITDLPSGFGDGEDNDTLYEAGVGITLFGNNLFSLLRFDIDSWTSGACYDVPTELFEFLELASVDHNHSFDSLAAVPASFTAGVDSDTTYTAGAGLALVDGGLRARGTPHSSVVTVAKTGGDFTDVQSAIDSVSNQRSSAPVLIQIAPGRYEGQVVTKPYVHLLGAGRDATVITSDISGAGASSSQATVLLGNNVSVRDLTIENTGTGTTNIALLSTKQAYQSLIAEVNVRSSATCTGACTHHAIYLQGDETQVTRVNIRSVTAYGKSSGLYNSNGATTNVWDSSFEGEAVGISNSDATLVARRTRMSAVLNLETQGCLVNTGGEVTIVGGSLLDGKVENRNPASSLTISQAKIVGTVDNLYSADLRMNNVVVTGEIDLIGTLIASNVFFEGVLDLDGASRLEISNSDLQGVDILISDYNWLYISNTNLSYLDGVLKHGAATLEGYVSNSNFRSSVNIESGSNVDVEISHSQIEAGTITGATCTAMTKGTTFYSTGCP